MNFKDGLSVFYYRLVTIIVILEKQYSIMYNVFSLNSDGIYSIHYDLVLWYDCRLHLITNVISASKIIILLLSS